MTNEELVENYLEISAMSLTNLKKIYDYDKLKPYYLYPYDYFAIDVEFNLEQCLSKGGTFTIGADLDCINNV